MKYKVELLDFEELKKHKLVSKEMIEYGLSNNGGGKEYANYILVSYDDKLVLLESDAMELEDKSFSRDLYWIIPALKEAYSLGLEESKWNLRN